MGELAESQALDTIVYGSGQGTRECWRQRLKAMRTELGYANSSSLEHSASNTLLAEPKLD
jgi:hypothetical protein